MSDSGISKALKLIFIVGVIATAVIFNANKPRVMVLHSYHPDYPWTRDIDVGIRRISENWTGYALTWHYMDTKKHSDKDWLRYAGIGARRAIDRFEPDVLIVIDDLAQKLAAKHYVNDPNMQIVFAGVNGYAEPYGYDKANNVTGIFERKPLKAVKEMILTLENSKSEPNPNPKIKYIMDPSPSIARDRQFIEAFDWAPIEYTGSVRAETFDEWKQHLNALADTDADYVLVANYRKLATSKEDKKRPPPKEVMKWTIEHSPIPVIGVNVFNVEDGGAIAVGASPFEQGETAARMAETLIKHDRKGSSIPMITNRQYVVAIDQEALRKRRLELPQIYETFARTTSTYIEERP